MKIFNLIVNLCCKFIYFFMKFKKTKSNKIVFMSRLSDKKSLDFSLIEKELKKKNNVECVFLCKRITSLFNGFIGNIIYTLKCLNDLADAKVCITDSYILALSVVNHKKSLKVIQIWHSMGAIKKFGYQSVNSVSGRSNKITEGLSMHKNYDYIISGSKEMTKYFMEAFNYSENIFLNYGLPRMDYLLKNNLKLKKKILNKYSKLNGKINILYVPTFRTNTEDKTMDLINNIDFDKYNLIVKAHANQSLNVNDKVLLCKEFSALELLSISDYVITDYSGIAIEAAILNKKTLYYVYDYEEYKKTNGLNIDLYEEMPGCVFSDAKDLIKYIDNGKYNMKNLIKYKNKYIDVKDGSSTKKIVELINKCLRK